MPFYQGVFEFWAHLLSLVGPHDNAWEFWSIPFLFQALVKRNTDLTPSPAEQTAVTNLVTKIQGVLDALIVTPGDFEACVSLTNLLCFTYVIRGKIPFGLTRWRTNLPQIANFYQCLMMGKVLPSVHGRRLCRSSFFFKWSFPFCKATWPKPVPHLGHEQRHTKEIIHQH